MAEKKTNGEAHKRIYEVYTKLFKETFGVEPMINYGWCGKRINESLKIHTDKALCRIIQLYFEHEPKVPGKFNLPQILSAYYINKYGPMIRLDPALYVNADEYNQ